MKRNETVPFAEMWIELASIRSKSGRGSVKVLFSQPCPALCDPVDCSLPNFSVHGIPQTRIPEWVSIPFSRRSS